MKTEYPNLPLIEERSKITLALVKELGYDSDAKFTARVFKQTWPVSNDSSSTTGVLSEPSFIDQYTTVMHEERTNNYLIFFGNEYAYRVYNPTEAFYRDFAQMHMASSEEAKNRY